MIQHVLLSDMQGSLLFQVAVTSEWWLRLLTRHTVEGLSSLIICGNSIGSQRKL